MAHGSLSNYMEALAPLLAPPLFSASAVEALQALARMLPPAGIGGFECRLGGQDPQVDLSFGVCRNDECRIALAGKHSRFSLGPCREDEAIWRSVAAFCTEWGSSFSPLYMQMESLWLEFDLKNPPACLPVPSPFLATSLASTLDRAEADRRFQTLLSVAVPLLCGRPLPNGLLEQIAFCRAVLPEGAWTRGLGFWLSRPEGGVRLWVLDLPAAQAAAYLGAIGWQGSGEKVMRLMEFGERCGATVELNLDISTGISSRVGVRLRRPSDQMFSRWHAALLEALVQEGWCSVAEQEALLPWHGVRLLLPEQDPMALEMEGLSRLRGVSMRTCLARIVDSFKISVHTDGSLEAKAYFGYTCFPCPEQSKLLQTLLS